MCARTAACVCVRACVRVCLARSLDSQKIHKNLFTTYIKILQSSGSMSICFFHIEKRVIIILMLEFQNFRYFNINIMTVLYTAQFIICKYFLLKVNTNFVFVHHTFFLFPTLIYNGHLDGEN